MSRKERIEQLLKTELCPEFLDVADESMLHHVPKGAETHFKITAVSKKFDQLPRLARHKLINSLLVNELATGLHALSMHLFTNEEWLQKKPVMPSPTCKDGYKNKAPDSGEPN